jgi:hypothetical protein
MAPILAAPREGPGRTGGNALVGRRALGQNVGVPELIPPDMRVRVSFLSARQEAVSEGATSEAATTGSDDAELHRARALGVDPALVTCDDTNLASRTVIEAAGGVLEDLRGVKLRYWVPTGSRTVPSP